MIKIDREILKPAAAAALRAYQKEIDAEPDFEARVRLAATRFGNRSNNVVFKEVRTALTRMCAGARRCMYCEDSVADEVEHHHPKNLYPDKVFHWENYLYACGPCNGPKNNRFAVIRRDGRMVDVTRGRGDPVVPPPAGTAALLDPCVEDPLDSIMLDIAGGTFLFVPMGDPASREFVRGQYTIAVLRLNIRDYLPVARREAYYSYRARVREYAAERDAGADSAALKRMENAIGKMQHPGVWREMKRQRALIPELSSLFRRVSEAVNW